MTFIALARRFDVAVVYADSDKYPVIADVTGPFVYARLQRTVEGAGQVGVAGQELAPLPDISTGIGAGLTRTCADLRGGHGGDVIMHAHSMQTHLMPRH